MPLTVTLTENEEQRLRQMAAQSGLRPEDLALQAVRDLLAPAEIADKIARLRRLLEGDPAEQQETGEYLQRVVDEDRLSGRRLFT